MADQEYIKCHGQGKIGLGIELVNPPTSEWDCRHQNLQQEV